VQEHVESEPPQLESLVRSVDEDTVNRHRPRGVHLAHRHCVIREEAQLQQKREENVRELRETRARNSSDPTNAVERKASPTCRLAKRSPDKTQLS